MAVGEWVRVADASEVEPGTGLRIDFEDDEPIAIWNVDGTFYATADTCTHEEASLSEGDLWSETVECYLHGAQFDVRTGEVQSLPAVLPLATYPVKVEDGGVYVEVSREL
jgi:3-phenylpropionate/trans-cinnamate dioxygenase ferredoxin component